MEGNQMKMREALSLVHQIADTAKSDFDVFAGIERIRRISMSALSEPPRQCDVGTPEEQTSRLRAVCDKFKPSCSGCKYITDLQKENCWLAWAQTPYAEEGGAK